LISTEFYDYTTVNDDESSSYPVSPITYHDCSMQKYGSMPFSAFIEIYNKPTKNRYDQNSSSNDIVINLKPNVDHCCPNSTQYRVPPIIPRYRCVEYGMPHRRRNASYTLTSVPKIKRRSAYRPRKPQIIAEFVDIFEGSNPRRIYTKRFCCRPIGRKDHHFKDIFNSRYFSKSPFYEESVYYDDYSDFSDFSDSEDYYRQRRRSSRDRRRSKYYDYHYQSEDDYINRESERSRDKYRPRYRNRDTPDRNRVDDRNRDTSDREKIYRKYQKTPTRDSSDSTSAKARFVEKEELKSNKSIKSSNKN
jgi:hypothetical protein